MWVVRSTWSMPYQNQLICLHATHATTKFLGEVDYLLNCLFTQWKWTHILDFGPWKWFAANMRFVNKWPSRMQGQWFCRKRAGGAGDLGRDWIAFLRTAPPPKRSRGWGGCLFERVFLWVWLVVTGYLQQCSPVNPRESQRMGGPHRVSSAVLSSPVNLPNKLRQ